MPKHTYALLYAMHTLFFDFSPFLFCAENTVSGITKSRANVCMIV